MALTETSGGECPISQMSIYAENLRAIFHEMILGQTDEATSTGETLGDEQTHGNGEFFGLRWCPAMDILEKGWQR
jgi:hypothetical protein